MKNKTTNETERSRGQHHLCDKITTSASDLLRENNHAVTGSEAMTEQERARDVMRRYGSKHNDNRNAIKSKP